MKEDRTAIERVANMNLEGLLLPEPAPTSYWWLWLVAGLIILSAILVWRKNYRSPKSIALRELKKLSNDIATYSNSQDPQQIKKKIARSLRQGFCVTRLDTVMPDNLKWKEYLNSLETALYAKHVNDDQIPLASLISSAQNWLRNH